MKIYLITDTTTGKKYVGSTLLTLERRFAGHCSSATNTPLGRAIAAVGKQYFTIQLLEETSSSTNRDRENYWITTLNTLAPIGFNAQRVKDNPDRKVSGPRPKDPAVKKKSYTLSLTPGEIGSLEAQAAEESCSPSELVIRKLKLNKPRK